jgi:UDP-N-acetylmuramyl pentapeptide phosphotransferase/UDP-N-acetylglucosamine-1-phosphate transferase
MKLISKPIFAMAVLCYPLLDTLRIFIYRTIKGTSPFTADKNHLHHRLIKLNLNHAQTVGVIYLFNIILIAYSVLAQGLNTSISFLILTAIVFLAMGLLFLFPLRRNKN